MTDLTDDDVVRDIAEFMGWTEISDPTTSFRWASPGKTHPDWCAPPPYLTSHDALAPVYRKLYADPDRFQRFNAACDAVERAIGLKGPLSCVGCYWVEPRDHAYAIARALRAARQTSQAETKSLGREIIDDLTSLVESAESGQLDEKFVVRKYERKGGEARQKEAT